MICAKQGRCWQPLCVAAILVVSGCEGYVSPARNHQHSTSAKADRRTGANAAAAKSRSSDESAPAAIAASTTADGGAYIGLAEDELLARLGPPAAQRDDEPPGRIWSYRHKHCTVDFTLYPDVQTRVYRALAYEVINDDKSAAAKRLCLAELESRARAQ